MITAAPRALVDYALAYTHRGWRVFPLHSIRQGSCSCGRESCHSPGKHPRTKNGVKDATRQPEQVRQWWTTWPDANIGIATGQGLYVIDIDTTKGGSLEPSSPAANDFRPLLQGSLAVRTGSGGYHIYLSLDPSLRLGNTAGSLGKGIDTRGEGGYVVAPPGRNQHGPYTWLSGQKELLPVPQKLLTLLRVISSVGNETHEVEKVRREENHEQIARPTQAHAVRDVQAPSPSNSLAPAAAVASAPAVLAHEGRNTYLIKLAGTLRAHGMNANQILSPTRPALVTVSTHRARCQSKRLNERTLKA